MKNVKCAKHTKQKNKPNTINYNFSTRFSARRGKIHRKIIKYLQAHKRKYNVLYNKQEEVVVGVV